MFKYTALTAVVFATAISLAPVGARADEMHDHMMMKKHMMKHDMMRHEMMRKHMTHKKMMMHHDM